MILFSKILVNVDQKQLKDNIFPNHHQLYISPKDKIENI